MARTNTRPIADGSELPVGSVVELASASDVAGNYVRANGGAVQRALWPELGAVMGKKQLYTEANVGLSEYEWIEGAKVITALGNVFYLFSDKGILSSVDGLEWTKMHSFEEGSILGQVRTLSSKIMWLRNGAFEVFDGVDVSALEIPVGFGDFHRFGVAHDGSALITYGKGPQGRSFYCSEDGSLVSLAHDPEIDGVSYKGLACVGGRFVLCLTGSGGVRSRAIAEGSAWSAGSNPGGTTYQVSDFFQYEDAVFFTSDYSSTVTLKKSTDGLAWADISYQRYNQSTRARALCKVYDDTGQDAGWALGATGNSSNDNSYLFQESPDGAAFDFSSISARGAYCPASVQSMASVDGIVLGLAPGRTMIRKVVADTHASFSPVNLAGLKTIDGTEYALLFSYYLSHYSQYRFFGFLRKVENGFRFYEGHGYLLDSGYHMPIGFYLDPEGTEPCLYTGRFDTHFYVYKHFKADSSHNYYSDDQIWYQVNFGASSAWGASKRIAVFDSAVYLYAQYSSSYYIAIIDFKTGVARTCSDFAYPPKNVGAGTDGRVYCIGATADSSTSTWNVESAAEGDFSFARVGRPVLVEMDGAENSPAASNVDQYIPFEVNGAVGFLAYNGGTLYLNEEGSWSKLYRIDCEVPSGSTIRGMYRIADGLVIVTDVGAYYTEDGRRWRAFGDFAYIANADLPLVFGGGKHPIAVRSYDTREGNLLTLGAPYDVNTWIPLPRVKTGKDGINAFIKGR